MESSQRAMQEHTNRTDKQRALVLWDLGTPQRFGASLALLVWTSMRETEPFALCVLSMLCVTLSLAT